MSDGIKRTPRSLLSNGSESEVEPHRREKATPDHILNRAGKLLGAYSKHNYPDPDSFVEQLVVTLERFPKEVVDYVTDTVTGVQSRLRFAPSIAEINVACEERLAELRRLWVQRHPRPVERLKDRSNRPTYEELKARYGENWGLEMAGPPRKRRWRR